MALNWFKKLKTGLSKSASKVEGAIASITGKKTIDQETLYDIEDQLILADLGVEVAVRIAKKIKEQKFDLNKNKEHKPISNLIPSTFFIVAGEKSADNLYVLDKCSIIDNFFSSLLLGASMLKICIVLLSNVINQLGNM